MSQLIAIIWNFKPEIFTNLDIPIISNVRWYGLLWAISFILAFQIIERMYKKENKNLAELDSLFFFSLIGCIVGARLGHCLFYAPAHFLQNPLEILMINQGGLASHGGGIGLFIACILFQRKFKSQSLRSILDKIALTVALAGCLIRFGNFLNSEIIGTPSDSAYSVAFVENVNAYLRSDNYYGKSLQKIEYLKHDSKADTTINGVHFPAYKMNLTFDRSIATPIEKNNVFAYLDSQHIIPVNEDTIISGNEVSRSVYLVTRHPAQLYESISCLVLFAFMMYLYFIKYKGAIPEGLLIGTFLTFVFTLRFLYEFIKENQEVHEEGWLLNTGQLLSIPSVLVGIFFLYKALKDK